ncbi:MAG: Ppx/GppA family phosphatase [Acidobacteria bacterium]|nr:Ppx/GppA family phosphatase [Acidobacteriota bacterium]
MTRAGVIDVGTNSVRVLVADLSPGGRVVTVVRDLVITRLGEGVDRGGSLGAEPIRRTVAAIAAYWERCRALGADRARIAATSAVRDAANRQEFLSAVHAATGLACDVLSGDEEARLGFLGATSELGEGAPFLVVDIGGGSTELVRGSRDAERWISVDVGSVRLTERHVRTDPPAGDELAAIARDADAALEAAEQVVDPRGARTLVGLAGTITTVAAVALGLDGYVRERIHHARLARREVSEILGRLAAMTVAERRALPAMPPGREDVIVAGVVVLDLLMERFGFDSCLVSEADILDGLALSLG